MLFVGETNCYFTCPFDELTERLSPSSDVLLEGILNRKHEWESATKRASNRSWEKLYVVLGKGTLGVYKDQKTYSKGPHLTFKGEEAANLRGAYVACASDYKKKKHVLRLNLSTGAEYLFEATNMVSA